MEKPTTTTGVCSDFTKANETSDIAMTWVKGAMTHSMTIQFKVGKDDSSWYFSKVGVSTTTGNGKNGNSILFVNFGTVT